MSFIRRGASVSVNKKVERGEEGRSERGRGRGEEGRGGEGRGRGRGGEGRGRGGEGRGGEGRGRGGEGRGRGGEGRGRGGEGRGRGEGRGELNLQDHNQSLSYAYQGNLQGLVNLSRLSPEAITLGQHPLVTDYLLRQGQSPNQNSDLAVVVACKMGQLKTLNKLVEAGANPAAQNNLPLRTAAEFGHDALITYLLQQPNTDPSVLNNEALESAKTFGYIRCAAILEQDPRVTPKPEEEV